MTDDEALEKGLLHIKKAAETGDDPELYSDEAAAIVLEIDRLRAAYRFAEGRYDERCKLHEKDARELIKLRAENESLKKMRDEDGAEIRTIAAENVAFRDELNQHRAADNWFNTAALSVVPLEYAYGFDPMNARNYLLVGAQRLREERDSLSRQLDHHKATLIQQTLITEREG